MAWKKQVEACFQGGLLDGEVIELRMAVCTDVLMFNDPDAAWFLQHPDGSVAIVKGKRTPSVPWISFSMLRYEKVDRIKDGVAQYRFSERVMVDRCETVLPGKQRRCGHEAIPGRPFCKTHQPQKQTP